MKLFSPDVFLEVLDASHEFNHIPCCEWFLFMLKHICAKKWMPKVAPVSWISYPHPVTLSKPPSHPLMNWPSREGKSRSGTHQWKSHETPVQRWNQRGGERRRRMAAMEKRRRRRGGMDFKNNNGKKTNNRGKKTSERKERGAEEAQKHPRSSN